MTLVTQSRKRLELPSEGHEEVATVLIVEDNPLNRDMLGRRLSRRGYSVLVASDGPDGVAMALKHRPDVVLMDIFLGEMDGIEATRQIKASRGGGSIPIIALTASAFQSDRDRALEAGCCEFETKPVDLPRLLSKIEYVIGVEERPRRAGP
jgi:CheY-like chemotaxis protein